MSQLSVFSLRNRALIALLTVVVAIFSGYSLTALKMELFPSLTLPNVTVVTTYPGASPDVVESSVSTPIETALQGIEGLEATSATSSSGVSTVQASFVYGTDLTRAEQKVEREPAAKVTGTNRDDSTVQAPKKREEKKIYPNDPCPCGSGKKYKQCCGRKLYAKN